LSYLWRPRCGWKAKKRAREGEEKKRKRLWEVFCVYIGLALLLSTSIRRKMRQNTEKGKEKKGKKKKKNGRRTKCSRTQSYNYAFSIYTESFRPKRKEKKNSTKWGKRGGWTKKTLNPL